MAEGWIKRLSVLKTKGRVERITVIIDYAVMTRHRPKMIMLQNVVDNIYLNTIYGNSAYVTNRTDEIENLKQDLNTIYGNSNSIRPGT